MEYECELLSQRISLLFVMAKFGCGATRKSVDFYLTLDGEGVAQELYPIRVNGNWGEAEGSPLYRAARYVQENIVPQLYDSAGFQKAMATVVLAEKYASVADATRFVWIDGKL